MEGKRKQGNDWHKQIKADRHTYILAHRQMDEQMNIKLTFNQILPTSADTIPLLLSVVTLQVLSADILSTANSLRSWLFTSWESGRNASPVTKMLWTPLSVTRGCRGTKCKTVRYMRSLITLARCKEWRHLIIIAIIFWCYSISFVHLHSVTRKSEVMNSSG